MKLIYFALCLLVSLGSSCKNKNPNLSKDELFSEMEQVSEVEVADTSSVMTEGHVPPAGIRYAAKLDRSEPLIHLDIEAALRNVRPVKLSDFGKEIVYHRIGVFEHGIDASFTPVEDGYLVICAEGLWWLDKNLKKDKLLIKNDVEFMSSGDFEGYSPHSMLKSYDYDLSSRSVYCQFFLEDKKNKSFVMYTARIPLAELRQRSSPMDLNDLPKWLKTKDEPNVFARIARVFIVKNGFALYRESLNALYTFAANGDTLCYFAPGSGEFKAMKGTIRNAESSDLYKYKGQECLRLAYTDTLFRTLDASTFRPAYKIDFGTHQATRAEGLNPAVDLSDKYLVHNLTETDDYLFLSLTQNHDCPNTRNAGTVKFFQVIYNKKNGELYSFVDKTKKTVPGLIPNDLDGGIGYWPKIQMNGQPYMLLIGRALKRAVPADRLSKIPALQGLEDKEMVLITVR